MYCPFCHAQETKVIDSRLMNEGEQVRRRRQCLACHERFTTFEAAEVMVPLVVKRDGRRESFKIDNLRGGMLRALEKRPFSIEDLDRSVETIMQKIRRFNHREIDSRLLGEWVMDELYTLDRVAYVRFASVYKRFQDVSDFRQTLDSMPLNPAKSDKEL